MLDMVDTFLLVLFGLAIAFMTAIVILYFYYLCS